MKFALEGTNVCLTGTFSFHTRDQLEVLIREAGGTVSRSVTKKTLLLIVGAHPSSKLAKARSPRTRAGMAGTSSPR